MANAIQNSTNVGAVAGTPGTFPISSGTASGWSLFGSTGLTITTAYGRESSGYPYVDLAVSGTCSDGFMQLTFGVAPASASLPWTLSAILQLMAGDFTNVTQVELDYDTSSGTLGSGTFITFDRLQQVVGPPTSAFVRYNGTATSDVGTTLITPYVFIPMSNTLAVSFTLRIAGVQLEQASAPTFWVPTPTPSFFPYRLTTQSAPLLAQ